MSPPRPELAYAITFGHFGLLCISLNCIRYLYKQTQNIQSMPGICFLLLWWLATVTFAYCLWGFRVAWAGLQSISLRELIWYVPIKMTFMCWPLVALSYWAAFAYRNEKFKSETLASQARDIERPWFLQLLNMKVFFPIILIPYILMLLSCVLTVSLMRNEELDQPAPDKYPPVIMISFMAGFIYNALLALPALYMLIKVSLDDVYGLRRTLSLAIVDAAFWTNLFFWFGSFWIDINKQVDLGTILAGALLTSQSNWVYRVTWNAYLNEKNTASMFTDLVPAPQPLAELPTTITILAKNDLRETWKFDERTEQEQNLFPGIRTHPLWAVLREKSQSEKGRKFLEICQKSLCTENVLAWSDIYRLAIEWDPTASAKNRNAKQELSSRYFGDNALWRLNLEGALLADLEEWERAETIIQDDLFQPSGILHRVLTAVFRNLEQDSWKRFQLSIRTNNRQ